MLSLIVLYINTSTSIKYNMACIKDWPEITNSQLFVLFKDTFITFPVIYPLWLYNFYIKILLIKLIVRWFKWLLLSKVRNIILCGPLSCQRCVTLKILQSIKLINTINMSCYHVLSTCHVAIKHNQSVASLMHKIFS